MGEWLNIIRVEPLTYLFKSITLLGNESFIYIFMPIIYWCWQKRSGVHLMILLILACYFNFLLKGIFGWERPPSSLWLIDATGYTFPSNHAVTAVIIWGYLAYEIRKRWFTVLAISVIVLISFSRVYLGVHYPQDVIAGLAEGVIYLYFYRFIIKWFGEKIYMINDLIKGGIVVLISLLMIVFQPNVLIATGAGMLAGIYLGFLIEPHIADFKTDSIWYFQLAKIAAGLLVLVILWHSFEWGFPEERSFRYFQFFILGLWMVAGAPWLFVQLRFAKREQ